MPLQLPLPSTVRPSGTERVTLTGNARLTTFDIEAPPTSPSAMSAPLIDPSPTLSMLAAPPQSLAAIARRIAVLIVCLASSIVVSIMLAPLFTVVRSSGAAGMMLPQLLFGTRMLADIGGRLLARSIAPSARGLQARATPPLPSRLA